MLVRLAAGSASPLVTALRPPGIQHYPLIQLFLTLFAPSTSWYAGCLGGICYSISEPHSFFQKGNFNPKRFSCLMRILG